MNLSGTLFCLNCGKPMKQGGTEIGPYGISQFRHCDCGLNIFLFTEVKGFEYSLVREPKAKSNKPLKNRPPRAAA